MSRYTITIRPDDPSEATTKVRVDVDGDAVRIGKLVLTPGDGDGLSARQLPTIDLSLLLRAVLPATASAVVTGRVVGSADAEVVAEPSVPAKGRKATGTRGRAKAAATDLPAPAKGRTRRGKGQAAKATPARRGGRPYRSRPDDILEVWAQAGSVTALADHYQVPRHTAQGWVGRLRAEGKIPSA